MEINKYLGELALIEIQLIDPEQTMKARERLLEMLDKYPRYPHAYIRLWVNDYISGYYSHSLDAIEPVYINYSEFYTFPELETLVTMIYAKSLFKEKHYITAFELLQNAFCKQPTFTVYLFVLGKYEVLSDLKNFRGSAIGILQECLRSCVTYRKAEIHYYLGLVYKKMGQPLKAFEFFQQSYELYKDKNYHPYGCPADKKKVIKSFIEEYYDINKFEYIIKRKAKAVQKAVKENKDVNMKDNTLESLISACNALIRADKINGALIRALLAWEIKMDKKEASSVYQKILEKYPYCMEAYFNYLEFLNNIGDMAKMEKVSEAMIEAAQNTSVPTLDWMKAHSLRSRTLLMLSKHKEAIEVLK